MVERDAPALLAPGRQACSYRELAAVCTHLAESLAAIGVRPGQPVALWAPNGPEAASAFLGISRVTACAPLNPASTTGELTFLLDDMQAAAVAVVGDAGPARDAADGLRVPVLDLLSDPARDPAGVFRTLVAMGTVAPLPPATEDAIALILHTSGTTAKPKQVPLSGRNLATSAANVARTLQLTESDRCGNVMPLFHIHGLVAALLASLQVGGSVLCTPGYEPGSYLASLREAGCTWYTAVPTIHQAVLGEVERSIDASQRPRLRFVRSASSPLPPTVMAGLERAFDAPVVEAYGMTEAAHQITCNPLPPGERRSGTVGPVHAGIAIMGAGGRLLPEGATGEVVIQGPNVTGGYLRNDEANAAAFVDGWFRTGDQGVVEDGYLRLTGRLKELINRGGEKISPREVDEVLLDHPAVARAATFATPHPTLGENVAAAVVLAAGASATEEELRAHAAGRLAPHKVPARILLVDAIPLGPTGKLQRVGLAAALGLDRETSAPAGADAAVYESGLEAALAGLWGHVLGGVTVGRHDRFVELGGDSLAALELIAQVGDLFGVDLDVGTVFERAATVADMAALVRERPRATRSAPPVDEPPDPGQLSIAQEALWFVEAFAPGNTAYNQALVARLQGPLDTAALDRAWHSTLGRHAVLHSRFSLIDGHPRVDHDGPLVPLTTATAADLDEVRHHVEWDLRVPFDLLDGPPVRATLHGIAPTDHVLAVVYHHIVGDETSRAVILDDLLELYRAEVEGTPPALVDQGPTYAEVAARQRHALGAGIDERTLGHWRTRLAHPPAPLELPTDYPRPSRQPRDLAVEEVVIEREGRDRLHALARELDATPFMLLVAAVTATLHRYTGREDLAIGTPVDERRASTRRVVGLMANNLVLRIDLSERPTFRELVARVRRTCLDALDHQDAPFSMLVAELKPDRDPSRPPLFQVMVQLRGAPRATTVGPLSVEELTSAPGGSKFDLDVDVVDHGDRLVCGIDHPPSLFSAATVGRLGAHLRRLTIALLDQPDRPIGEQPMLTDAEEAELLTFGRGASAGPPPATVLGALHRRTEEDPHAIALVDGDRRLTRSELATAARRLACALTARGVTRGDRVGVHVERSAGSVAAMLGVLEAGAAFVPLDPTYPADRLAATVADARPAAVISRSPADIDAGEAPIVDLDEALAHEPAAGDRPPADVGLDDLAYVMYTSGSTGRPKGVMGLHRGIANRLAWMERTHPWGGSDVACHRAPLGFVDSVAEVLGPLCAGVPLVVLGDDDVRDPERLVDRLAEHRVTRLLVVPSVLSAVLEYVPDVGERLPDLRLCVSSGEPLLPGLAVRFGRHLPHCRLLNLYGSTEVSADAVAHLVRESHGGAALEELPVGRPIDDMAVAVVDGGGGLMPIGATGELWVGGAGLAHGYWGDDGLTAARFVTPPEVLRAGLGVERMFRTGDLARWNPAGRLHLAGRADRQLKVRGMRVEPGEVEAVLAADPSVASAAVALMGVGTRTRLVAFVVPATGATVQPDQLLAAARAALPTHMVPARVRVVDELPLTPSGKLDRLKLERINLERAAGSHATGLEDPVTAELRAIWQELLEVDAVAPEDDFFELGGHSLLAVQLFIEVEERLGCRLPLDQLFESPTLVALAAAVRTARTAAGERTTGRSTAVALNAGVAGALPFFWVPGIGGATLALGRLAQAMPEDRPLYGLESPGHRPGEVPFDRIEDLAAAHVASITALWPGPYVVGGNSFGGLVAWEIACQLAEADAAVPEVVIGDTRPFIRTESVKRDLTPVEVGARMANASVEGRMELVRRVSAQAQRRYVPRAFAGDVTVLGTAGRRAEAAGATLGWAAIAGGVVRTVEISGEHNRIMRPPGVDEVARAVTDRLEAIAPIR
jgi:amino acid adenylation domain-containing protein